MLTSSILRNCRKFVVGLFCGSAIAWLVLLAAYLFVRPYTEHSRDLVGSIIFLLGLVHTTYVLVKRQEQGWESFTLGFRDGKLVRTGHELADFELRPDEITAIVEYPSGIKIATGDPLRQLFVSKKLTGYDEFRSRLVAWATSTKVERAGPSLARGLANLASVAGCVTVFLSPLYIMYTLHRERVLPVGVLSTLAFIAMFMYARRSPFSA